MPKPASQFKELDPVQFDQHFKDGGQSQKQGCQWEVIKHVELGI